jgi:hypothetical protein
MAIFIKGRGWNPLTLGVAYRVEYYTPLSNIDRRVFEEVVEENLDNKNVFNLTAEKWRQPTSLNSRPLLS